MGTFPFRNSSGGTGAAVEIEHQDALRAAVGVLERLRIPYFLFGANAQNVWGQPRYTKDADFVLFLDEPGFADLLSGLGSSGFAVDPTRDAGRLQAGRMIKLGFAGITVDFVLGETEFDRSALARRRQKEYLGMSLEVASPEDVILYKLIAHRSHDLGDIEGIIRKQRAHLDRAYLRTWARWLSRETGLPRIQSTLSRLLREFGRKR